jgi:hypothetical protein
LFLLGDFRLNLGLTSLIGLSGFIGLGGLLWLYRRCFSLLRLYRRYIASLLRRRSYFVVPRTNATLKASDIYLGLWVFLAYLRRKLFTDYLYLNIIEGRREVVINKEDLDIVAVENFYSVINDIILTCLLDSGSDVADFAIY